MARTTISDCMKYVDDKYELNLLAGQRVRDLTAGTEPVVPTRDDKRIVIALREIASGKLDANALRDELIQSYKSLGKIDFNAIEETEVEDPLLKEIDAELADNVAPEIIEAEIVNDEAEVAPAPEAE